MRSSPDTEGLGPDADAEASERVVLAAVLSEPARLDDLSRFVGEPDFKNGLCRALFGIVVALTRAGKPTDLQTVRESFWRTYPTHFASVTEMVAVTRELSEGYGGNAEHHARRVRDQGTLRRLIEAGVAIARLGRQPHGPPVEMLAAAGAALSAVEDAAGHADAVDLADALHEMIDEMTARLDAGRPDTVPTGLGELDGLLGGGLRGGQLAVVAARPAVGKTSLAVALAASGAGAGHRALFSSLEQSRVELAERMVAGELRMDSRLLRSHELSGKALGDILDARRSLGDRLGRSLVFDDRPRQSPAHIAQQARRLRRKGGLGLVVVDYLGLLTAPEGKAGGQKKRHEVVDDLSRDLKQLARSLRVPVVLLAQLNREIEGRGDKARPRLSDLRESGGIEQNADVVLFLYRDQQQPHHSPGEPPPAQSWVNLDLAKQRNGPVGSVPLVFDRPSTTFAVAPMSDPRRKA